jgi:ribonucleoside-diphosphate reductase alpha chain
MLLNTLSYVLDRFKEGARFDYDKLYRHAYIAQRLMDDLIDLELEMIDRIIEKVQSDPEPQFIKLP